MPDELYETFGDILHEIPELEEPLRAWRERQSLDAARRRARARWLEILTKCYCGLPEPDEGGPSNS